jgi:hypothetical protein
MSLLDELDAKGYRMIMYTLGDECNGGNGMYGISDPCYGGTPMDIGQAKIYIDRLAGQNSLGHNFITDPRIVMWSIGNEANIGSATPSGFVWNSNGLWMREMASYIRSKGGEVSFPHPYADTDQIGRWKNDWDSLQWVAPAIDPYVDYMDWHLYGTGLFSLPPSSGGFLVQEVSGGQSVYDWHAWRSYMVNEFQKAAQYRGTKDIDHVFISEFGMVEGVSNEWWGGTWTYTAQDRLNYFSNWFQALDASGTGIRNLCVHSGWASDGFPLFDSSGNFRSGAQIVADYFGAIQ